MLSPGVESDLKSPIVTISLGLKRSNLDCYGYLYKKGFVIKIVADNQCGSGVENAARFTFHGYNTREEGRELVDALKEFIEG